MPACRIACRLYLPETWAEDVVQRTKAGVPEAIGFETKPGIALGRISQVQALDSLHWDARTL